MIAQQVEAYLHVVAEELSSYHVQIGRRESVPFMRFGRANEPGVWAEISTPGVLWCRLCVNGGFLLIDTTDEPEDDEVMQAIDEYVTIARAYLETSPEAVGRVFPTLTVETPYGKKLLKRSLATDLRALLSGRRR